jgi:hypothetical protein
LFSWSPDPARIVRFDDREAAEAELTRVQSFAANARLRGAVMPFDNTTLRQPIPLRAIP